MTTQTTGISQSSHNNSPLSQPTANQSVMPESLPETASRAAELFSQGRQGEATALLNQTTDSLPDPLKEALHRRVGGEVNQSLVPSGALGIQSLYASPVEIGNALREINAAANAPAMPDTQGLTDAQKFEVYASLIDTRGNEAARQALEDGDTVILGLRAESLTTVNAGQGEYNDRLVVMSRHSDGTITVNEFDRANTDPTAQYDSVLRGQNGINSRSDQGIDVNGDGNRDMGRIAEGTMEMKPAVHGSDNHFSLRPTDDAVAHGQNQVQRDSNHDGRFNSDDTNGEQDLNNTFKIHRGGSSNVYSAGCTTLHPADYQDFVDAVQANDSQSRWQYVLVETSDQS